MSLRIYNSLSRRKEELRPVEPGRVGIYVCGPTVYDDCHIGHLMGPLLFDAIVRWLRARGYAVRFVNNITDIDDKIIGRARETGEDWRAIAGRYTEQYLGFLARLGVDGVSDHPRCTDYIEAMVAYVADLVERDIAYPTSDGVYFDIARVADYGRLSGRAADELRAGARIERGAELRQPGDFCLWKLAKPGEPSWDSPWGAGRPGWHIECSVMASSLLGDTFDIHGGGDDLKFPHHENEIAQGRAHGGDYARIWMHNGLIQYEGAKISKSDPRMRDPDFARRFQAAHLLDTYGPATLRFFVLRGHYRRPFDFAPQHLTDAQAALGRLHQTLGGLMTEPSAPDLDELLARDLPEGAAAARTRFAAAMDDDFNTGAAIAQLFTLVGQARKTSAPEPLLRLVRDLARLLGLCRPGDRAVPEATAVDTGATGPDDAAVEELCRQRREARAARDFATADRIRDELAAQSIVLTDGPDGTTWQRQG